MSFFSSVSLLPPTPSFLTAYNTPRPFSTDTSVSITPVHTTTTGNSTEDTDTDYLTRYLTKRIEVLEKQIDIARDKIVFSSKTEYIRTNSKTIMYETVNDTILVVFFDTGNKYSVRRVNNEYSVIILQVTTSFFLPDLEEIVYGCISQDIRKRCYDNVDYAQTLSMTLFVHVPDGMRLNTTRQYNIVRHTVFDEPLLYSASQYVYTIRVNSNFVVSLV